MKKIVLFIIIILSTNCVGQNKVLTFNLQQIEFKDKMLTKTLFDISKSESDCFKKNGFYILDFFQSSLSNEEYYLSIGEFITESNIPNTISYYVVINNMTFFISNKVNLDIFRVLPIKKMFSNKMKYPIL
ncbi:MAG: hypothetical protein WBH98_07045 [Bacteroidales bacterium]